MVFWGGFSGFRSNLKTYNITLAWTVAVRAVGPADDFGASAEVSNRAFEIHKNCTTTPQKPINAPIAVCKGQPTFAHPLVTVAIHCVGDCSFAIWRFSSSHGGSPFVSSIYLGIPVSPWPLESPPGSDHREDCGGSFRPLDSWTVKAVKIPIKIDGWWWLEPWNLIRLSHHTWEMSHHPNWRTHSIIFQRGKLKPSTRWCTLWYNQTWQAAI